MQVMTGYNHQPDSGEVRSSRAASCRHLRVITDLKIIPAETAHVLHAYHGYISRLDLFEEGSESGPVEISSGIAVIGEMPDIRQPLGSGIVFQLFLLVQDAVGLALKLIIPGQSLIKCCDLVSSHNPPISFLSR